MGDCRLSRMEYSLGSRRLNINRESNTHERLFIVSAFFLKKFNLMMLLRIRHGGCGAARYFLDEVRTQT